MADAVYDYGQRERLQADTTFSPSPNSPGPSYPRLDAWQYGVFGLDRISIGEHWRVLAGGKEVLLRQRSWSSLDGDATHTDRSVFLPQVALVYKPVNVLSLYASYSKRAVARAQADARDQRAYAFCRRSNRTSSRSVQNTTGSTG